MKIALCIVFPLLALAALSPLSIAKPKNGKGPKGNTVSILECTLLGGTIDFTRGYSCCIGDTCAPIKDSPKGGGKKK